MSGSATVGVAQRKREARESLVEYNASDCVDRLWSIAGASLMAGGLMGAVQASWDEASHVGVARSSKWSMVVSTGRGVGKMALLFGAVGVAFGAGECMSQTYHNDRENSWRNKAWGGVCAGLAIGALSGSVAGGVGSAAALAALTGLFAALPPLAPNYEEEQADAKRDKA